eukprot:scpid95228/ scgid28988/ 
MLANGPCPPCGSNCRREEYTNGQMPIAGEIHVLRQHINCLPAVVFGVLCKRVHPPLHLPSYGLKCEVHALNKALSLSCPTNSMITNIPHILLLQLHKLARTPTCERMCRQQPMQQGEHTRTHTPTSTCTSTHACTRTRTHT